MREKARLAALERETATAFGPCPRHNGPAFGRGLRYNLSGTRKR